MEHWLKNTIPGLLVLGMLGSLLALLVLRILKFLKTLLLEVLPEKVKIAVKATVKGILERMLKYSYNHGKEFGYHEGLDGLSGIVRYYAYNVLFSILYALVACTAFSFGLYGFLENKATVIVLTGFVVGMLMLRYSLNHSLAVFMAYKLVPRMKPKGSREQKPKKAKIE